MWARMVAEEFCAHLAESIVDDHEQDVRLNVREPGPSPAPALTFRPVRYAHGWWLLECASEALAGRWPSCVLVSCQHTHSALRSGSCPHAWPRARCRPAPLAARLHALARRGWAGALNRHAL